MKTEKTEINETLLELLIGILLFGMLCQLSIVWFVTDRTGYSVGLWIGVVLAGLSAVHMYRSLDRALDFEASAARVIQKNSIIRYVVIVTVLAIIMITEAANPLAAFLGLMGLKVAAYIQPFTHKFLRSKNKNNKL